VRREVVGYEAGLQTLGENEKEISREGDEKGGAEEHSGKGLEAGEAERTAEFFPRARGEISQ